MINLSRPSTIMFGDESVAISRQSRQVGVGINYISGRAVLDASQTTTYTVRCNVQPVSGEDLELLPEDQQTTDQWYLFCQKQATMPQVGDLFERDGQTYQIQDADDWGAYVKARGINSQALQNLAGYDA